MNSTEIGNLALGHLGIGTSITSLDEGSSESRVINRFFNPAKEMFLSDFRWPFSRRFRTLGLIEVDPTSEWGFSYRYPTDAMYIRRLLSGDRNDSVETEVPYLIGHDDTGQLIYTDVADCEIEYTGECDNIALFPPDAAMAFSFLLASLIAPQIAKNDPNNKLGVKAYELYRMHSSRAIAGRLAEERHDNTPEDSFTRSRI